MILVLQFEGLDTSPTRVVVGTSLTVFGSRRNTFGNPVIMERKISRTRLEWVSGRNIQSGGGGRW